MFVLVYYFKNTQFLQEDTLHLVVFECLFWYIILRIHSFYKKIHCIQLYLNVCFGILFFKNTQFLQEDTLHLVVFECLFWYIILRIHSFYKKIHCI